MDGQRPPCRARPDPPAADPLSPRRARPGRTRSPWRTDARHSAATVLRRRLRCRLAGDHPRAGRPTVPTCRRPFRRGCALTWGNRSLECSEVARSGAEWGITRTDPRGRPIAARPGRTQMTGEARRCSPASTGTRWTARDGWPSPPEFRAQLESGCGRLALAGRLPGDPHPGRAGSASPTKVAALPITDPTARRFQRFVFSGAVEAELDRPGTRPAAGLPARGGGTRPTKP